MNRDDCIRAELVERADFTPDHAMMRFRPETPFAFRAGQYATIALEDGELLVSRAYSVVSSPTDPLLEFFIELVPGGALTPRLWELKIGDKVYIRKRAAGRLRFVERPEIQNHLIVATVTGLAPFISMARTYAVKHGPDGNAAHQFAIIHGGSRSDSLGSYKDEVTALSRQGWLHYVPTVSRPWEEIDWPGETGRVEDVLRKYADSLRVTASNAVAYLVGHPQMIENAKAVLKRARFSESNIEEERFFQMHDSVAAPQPQHSGAISPPI